VGVMVAGPTPIRRDDRSEATFAPGAA